MRGSEPIKQQTQKQFTGENIIIHSTKLNFFICNFRYSKWSHLHKWNLETPLETYIDGRFNCLQS